MLSFVHSVLTFFTFTHSSRSMQVQARDDPLRLILKELGPPPVSASAELSRARADEIELTLIPRLQSHEGE